MNPLKSECPELGAFLSVSQYPKGSDDLLGVARVDYHRIFVPVAIDDNLAESIDLGRYQRRTHGEGLEGDDPEWLMSRGHEHGIGGSVEILELLTIMKPDPSEALWVRFLESTNSLCYSPLLF